MIKEEFGFGSTIEEATEQEKGLKSRECTVCFEKEEAEMLLMELMEQWEAAQEG